MVQKPEAPAIAAECEEKALQALLTVEHHSEVSRRVALAYLSVIEFARAIRNPPERPRRNPCKFIVVDVPKKQRAKRPPSQKRVDEKSYLAWSPNIRTL
jgi:hypothetical protein